MSGMIGHNRRITEVVRALADHAEEISVKLLGEPTFKSRKEYRWGRRGSVWLGRAGDDRGRWYDHERGQGGDLLSLMARERGLKFSEAIRVAEQYLGGGVEVPKPHRSRQPEPSPPLTAIEDVEGRIRAALQKWREAIPISGTPGESYFVDHRRLDIAGFNLDSCLRWHAEIRAVVALMTDPVLNEPIGIHRTFLNAGGAKIERKMLGRQGVVRLSPNSEVTLGLGITEGVEDGLAILLSGWAPVWAATSAGAIARFPVLPGIEALTIFADADAPGMSAAKTCAERWHSVGLDVRISRPTREVAHVR